MTSTHVGTRTLSVIEAVREALHEEMARDERVVVLGEDIGPLGGVFRATDGLLARFGPQRVLWASNWPATRFGDGYEVMLDDAQSFLTGLSPAEIDAVLGANARRVYRC